MQVRLDTPSTSTQVIPDIPSARSQARPVIFSTRRGRRRGRGARVSRSRHTQSAAHERRQATAAQQVEVWDWQGSVFIPETFDFDASDSGIRDECSIIDEPSDSDYFLSFCDSDLP